MSKLDFWKQLIEDRRQTVAWDLDKELPLETINEILQELHRRAPVKQNRVHYQISIVDFSDPEFRNTYYEFCVDRDNPNPQYNSQVLAHYLLVFSYRDPGYFADEFCKTSRNSSEKLSHIEIGLAADFIVHAAAARDLACGFCRCYDFDYKPDIIMNKLGLDEIGDIFLTIGIGHSSNETTTFNPFTNKFVEAPDDPKWLVEPKPDMTKYIKYIQ